MHGSAYFQQPTVEEPGSSSWTPPATRQGAASPTTSSCLPGLHHPRVPAREPSVPPTASALGLGACLMTVLLSSHVAPASGRAPPLSLLLPFDAAPELGASADALAVAKAAAGPVWSSSAQDGRGRLRHQGRLCWLSGLWVPVLGVAGRHGRGRDNCPCAYPMHWRPEG